MVIKSVSVFLWGTLLPPSGSEDSLLSSLPLFFCEEELDKIYLAITSSWLLPEEGLLLKDNLDVLTLRTARKVAYKLQFSKGERCSIAPGEIVAVMGPKYFALMKYLGNMIPVLDSFFKVDGAIVWHETRNAGWISLMTWDRYKSLCEDLFVCLEGEFCKHVRDLSALPQADALLKLLQNTPSDDHNWVLLLTLALAKQKSSPESFLNSNLMRFAVLELGKDAVELDGIVNGILG